MKVSETDVERVAALANLELTPDERTRMVRDLNSILDYMDRLNRLDTSSVTPMSEVSDPKSINGPNQRSNSNNGRDDLLEGLRKSLAHDIALANAPESDGTFFEVPKVIEK